MATDEVRDVMCKEFVAVNSWIINSERKIENKIETFEFSKEHQSVSDFFNQSNIEVYSFDEVYPNYAQKTELVAGPEDVSVFEVVKQVKKILDDSAAGAATGYNKDCLKELKLSGIVDKVLPNDSYDSLKKKVGDVILAEYETILDKIGALAEPEREPQTTLLEVYNKFKDINEKLVTTIGLNYRELGNNLISYGILIITFNQLVLYRPIPKSVVGEELKIIQSTRTFSKFWFAGLIAPLMLFSLHQIRENLSFLNVNLPNVNIENYDYSTKEINLGLFFLLKQVKTKVNVSVIIFTLLILILMFWMFDGMRMMYYIKELKNDIYSSYLNYLLLLFILVPIFINGIILYLLGKLEKKGEISIPKNKLLPGIFNRFINYLMKISKNKELLSYYKGRCKAELVFYVVILILYFLFV